MFKLSDSASRKQFRSTEKAIGMAYGLFILVVSILKIIGVYRSFLPCNQNVVTLNDWPIVLAELSPLANMIIIFVVLSYYLKKYYRFDYKDN